MAKKITDLTALVAGEDDDYVPLYEDSSGITKKIKLSALATYLATQQLDNVQLNEAVNLTATSTELNQLAGLDLPEHFYGLFSRSRLVYNGGATAYTVKCEPGSYYCLTKFAYWTGDLTTAAISSPVADTMYYLYIDYSAITSHTALTDGTTELIWSTTAPTWNDTYKQWLNGNDRCIGAALANSTPDDIVEFFHDGDFVLFADRITDLAATDVDTTLVDTTLSIPGFARMADVSFAIDANNDSSNNTFYWHTTGQTGSSGHLIGTVDNDLFGNVSLVMNTRVITDASQQVSVVCSRDSAARAAIYTNGFYLPIGM